MLTNRRHSPTATGGPPSAASATLVPTVQSSGLLATPRARRAVGARITQELHADVMDHNAVDEDPGQVPELTTTATLITALVELPSLP
jgi:hypothetical protein